MGREHGFSPQHLCLVIHPWESQKWCHEHRGVGEPGGWKTDTVVGIKVKERDKRTTCPEGISIYFLIWTRCSQYIISCNLHHSPEASPWPSEDPKSRRLNNLSKNIQLHWSWDCVQSLLSRHVSPRYRKSGICRIEETKGEKLKLKILK